MTHEPHISHMNVSFTKAVLFLSWVSLSLSCLSLSLSCVFYQRRPISASHSRILHPKSTILHQQTPIFRHNIHISNQKSPIFVKRALSCTKRALFFIYSIKKLYFEEKHHGRFKTLVSQAKASLSTKEPYLARKGFLQFTKKSAIFRQKSRDFSLKEPHLSTHFHEKSGLHLSTLSELGPIFRLFLNWGPSFDSFLTGAHLSTKDGPQFLLCRKMSKDDEK